MKINTLYKTPEGEYHTVLMVDELNKMVYINIGGSRHRWVHEPEYSTWTEVNTVYVPDIPAQMTDEQNESVGEEIVEKPKKRATKNKSNESSTDTGII